MSYPMVYYDTQDSYAPYYGQYDQTAVASPYSQATYGSTSSSISKDEKDSKWDDNGPSTVMLFTGIVLFSLVGSVLTLIWLTLGPRSATEATLADAPGGYSIGGGSIQLYVRTSAQNLTIAAHPDASNVVQAPQREMIVGEPLVCTVGTKANSTQMFPPDALCDYIFYDSLYKGYTNPLLAPSGFDTSLSAFVDAYAMYNTTAFGVGIAYSTATRLTMILNQQGAPFEPLKPFWEHSIYHFGILDVETVDMTEAGVTEALQCLKALHSESQQIRAMGFKTLSFLAAAVPDDSWADIYANNFKSVYEPDLFIAIGHYVRGDNTLPTCIIMPPTALHRPSTGHDSYQHDLTSAVGGLATLSTPGSKMKMALSVTLKGRLATAAQAGMRSFLDECVSNSSMDSFASYAEVCQSPDYAKRLLSSSLHGATQMRHNDGSLVFSYDNRAGVSEKLCTVKAQHTSLKFGIAVFDLDYAQFTSVCSKARGTFPILRGLRRVLDFFKTGHVTRTNVGECAKKAT